MLPATEAPVAMACTWPATKAETVALLSSRRLTSAVGGASLVISMSSMAPRVTATVLPARSAKLLTGSALAANTAWKKGEYAAVKSITFSRSAFLPSVEMTRCAFLVCR